MKPRSTLLLISVEKSPTKVAGYAYGRTTPWTVDCELPQYQFDHLLMMIFSDKLTIVDMAFDRLRWQKGAMLSVEFMTRQLSSDTR